MFRPLKVEFIMMIFVSLQFYIRLGLLSSSTIQLKGLSPLGIIFTNPYNYIRRLLNPWKPSLQMNCSFLSTGMLLSQLGLLFFLIRVVG